MITNTMPQQFCFPVTDMHSTVWMTFPFRSVERKSCSMLLCKIHCRSKFWWTPTRVKHMIAKWCLECDNLHLKRTKEIMFVLMFCYSLYSVKHLAGLNLSQWSNKLESITLSLMIQLSIVFSSQLNRYQP